MKIAMRCNLKARQSFWADVLSNSVLRMRRNCYLRASGQNSDSAVGFGDPDFLYMDILAIGGHSP